MSLLPSVLCLLVFKVLTPIKSWSFKKSISYLFFGICSPLVLILLYNFFPSLYGIYKLSDVVTTQLLLMSFIQIALLEEVVKFVSFVTYNKFFNKIEKDTHPLSIMMYSGATSLGFAFIENVKYGMDYGLENVYWRSVTSVLMHLSFGMMMGYWISLSKFNYNIKINPMGSRNNISIFERYMKNNPKLRMVFYSIIGIITATFFHGLYDMNFLGVHQFTVSQSEFNSTWTTQLIIMIFSFYVTKKMSDHLIRLNDNRLK